MAPKKTTGRKRKGMGKRTWSKFNRGKSKLGRPSRSLVASKYFFTRTIMEVRSSLSAATAGQWHTTSDGKETSWYQSFELNDLNDYTDFTNLFTSYRINAVSIKLYPQATVIGQGNADGSADFSQVICYVVPNLYGRYSTSANISEQIALDTQSTKIKRWVSGNPLKLYTKVKQLGVVYNSPTNDYVKMSPKLISTDEVDTPHYGLSILFVNQNGGSLPDVPVKIITKYFIECRGAK